MSGENLASFFRLFWVRGQSVFRILPSFSSDLSYILTEWLEMIICSDWSGFLFFSFVHHKLRTSPGFLQRASEATDRGQVRRPRPGSNYVSCLIIFWSMVSVWYSYVLVCLLFCHVSSFDAHHIRDGQKNQHRWHVHFGLHLHSRRSTDIRRQQ